MADIMTMFTDAFGLFSSDLTSALIIFFLGFLVDHIIMSIIQMIKEMTLGGKIKVFIKSFFFMPPR